MAKGLKKTGATLLAMLLSFVMLFSCIPRFAYAENSTGEFHRVTDGADFQVGAHYVIVHRDSEEMPAELWTLSTHEDDYVTKVRQTEKDVLRVDLDGDNVFTLKRFANSSSNEVVAIAYARMDANNGQNLKLQKYRNAQEGTMFSGDSDGNLSIVQATTEGKNEFIFCNSDAYLRFDEDHFIVTNNSGATFELWTDAQPKKAQGERQYIEYEPLGLDPLNIILNDEMSLVYTAGDGKSYALSAEDDGTNAVNVDVTKVTAKTGTATQAVMLDRSQTWAKVGTWELEDTLGDTQVYKTSLKQDRKYLWASIGDLFSTDTAKNIFFYLDRSDEADLKIYVHGPRGETEGQRYIGWDDNEKQFIFNQTRENAADFRVFAANKNQVFNTYYRLTDLSKLQDVDQFMIVVPQTNEKTGETVRYAMGENNGERFIPVRVDEETGSVTVEGAMDMVNCQFTHGVLESSDEQTYWTFNYINIKDGSYYYPQYLPGSIFQSKPRSVRFEYASKSDPTIYLRGNSNSTYLGYVDGQFTTVERNSENRVPVEIYAMSVEDPITVNYHDIHGEIADTIYSQRYLTLEKLPDVTNDGTTYSFAGWSTDSSFAADPYLSLEDSCDIYDYTEADGASIKQDVKEKHSIVGTGIPDRPDNIDLNVVMAEGQTEIDLYPVYAVRGFDTVVTTNDGDTAIIGISDWKALEHGTGYKSTEKEKWLGCINVEVYKDGEPWTEPAKMYFSYHNDDAADLNIKFIWDDILAKYTGEDPLYDYLSDISNFPAYDQTGHYVIDGVYATQGGSETGLEYSLNWITDHGGQLDNVAGGSTVKIYVTSKYDVRYYLDDELITDSKWVNSNTYTTKGTMDLFTKDTEDADYAVTTENDLKDLMVNDKYEAGDCFETEEISRGGYNTFSYFINDYVHTIPVAPSPEKLAADGRTLESEDWTVKDADGKEVDHAAWSADYALTGTAYGTGNTAYAYHDGEALTENGAHWTFHLYAYTKEKPQVEPPKEEPPKEEPPAQKPDQPELPVGGVQQPTQQYPPLIPPINMGVIEDDPKDDTEGSYDKEDPGDESEGSESNEEEEPDEANDEAPQTGDTSMLSLWSLVLVQAVCAAILWRKRQEDETGEVENSENRI